MTVTGDTWFYLTATWSRRTGLTVYIDDRPVSTVPSGTSGVNYQIYTKTPNFVIGRSATAASYYSKVNIGSFSTYKQLLSSGDVKANYRFFWIRGKRRRIVFYAARLVGDFMSYCFITCPQFANCKID